MRWNWKGIYFTCWLVRRSNDNEISKLKNRSSASVSDSVKLLLADMDQRQFSALADYSLKFDKFRLNMENIKIPKEEIEKQASELTKQQIRAIDFAYAQTKTLQEKIAQFITPISIQSKFGVTKFIPKPIDRVGIYVPGGLAPLPSSLLMAAVSAKAAGVKDIILCTPPRSDGLSPAIAYLMLKLGIKDAFWLGGVAAIWFMANGISPFKAVDKICGPGNSFVTEAKSQLSQSGKIGIDMIAGPSEVLIIADGSANPAYIAADLLAQAEHGINSSSVLLTDSKELAIAVQNEIDFQLSKMKRKKEIKQALETCGGIFVIDDPISQGVAMANQFVPEHLEIYCKKSLCDSILSCNPKAGAIFINTCEAFADYGMTGGNHILPTNRTARFSSGLSAKDFFIWQYVEELSDQAQSNLSDFTTKFADLESLEAHSNAAKLRKR
ncbi:Histidinol dehydrogenase [Candidatus Bilamarchaeum dharawalense]|uniref:Histidinol dehydrogenase n=1 Tax=Candidatus Bilamarchaeum dharawalense TaxID=2885759 RepID=A0A5E4LSD5_9ARCH|nr:Histidinol dehydrogenase [Candidatus Bilamarchaeum dharawalense]